MLIDTGQPWEAWTAYERRLAGYSGSLGWQPLRSGQHLVKNTADPDTGQRKARSLGPRSPETERILAQFQRGRSKARATAASLRQRMAVQARLDVAIGIARVPDLPARILRRLGREGLLGRNVFIAGTGAIYAYEATAGVLVERHLLATGDLDIPWRTERSSNKPPPQNRNRPSPATVHESGPNPGPVPPMDPSCPWRELGGARRHAPVPLPPG